MEKSLLNDIQVLKIYLIPIMFLNSQKHSMVSNKLQRLGMRDYLRFFYIIISERKNRYYAFHSKIRSSILIEQIYMDDIILKVVTLFRMRILRIL